MSSQKKKNDNRIWQRRQLLNEIIMKLIGNAHRAPSAIVRNPMVKEKFRKVTLDQEYIEKAQAVFV